MKAGRFSLDEDSFPAASCILVNKQDAMFTLTVQGISKQFGQVLALSNVSAVFKSGEVHAVLGENGAGKSTLVSILAGFVAPDTGTASLHRDETSSPLPLGRPTQLRAMGIEMVHQHFMLVPNFTVAENICLSQLDSLVRPLNTEKLLQSARSTAEQLGWQIDFNARTRDLPVGVQQRIEILKALNPPSNSPKLTPNILILDEPTAVLSPTEVQDLFRVIRKLRSDGSMIILIAHKLSEIQQVADHVTVLRKGELIASVPFKETSLQQLAMWMVGEVPPKSQKSERSIGSSGFLTVSNISVAGDRGEIAIRDVTFEIAQGEILGIGGVDGNGQVELAETVAGIRELISGEVRTHSGGPLRVAYIPQDRRADGLALEMSISDNLLIAGYESDLLNRGPLLSPSRIASWSDSLIAEYEIKVGSRSDPVSSLSGGNQQKVVVSRSLQSDPEILVVVNPTRGLDFRATEFVHQQIKRSRDKGAAVLLVSTDTDELAALSDRTFFLSRGQLTRSGVEALVGGTS